MIPDVKNLSSEPGKRLFLNTVKCNLKTCKLTTKKSWHSLGGQRLLVVSACTEHHIAVADVQAWWCIADFLWSFWLVIVSVFLSLPRPLVSVFHCLRSVTGVRMTGPGGSWLGCGDCHGVCHCLGASWSQWRPLGLIPGTQLLPLSLMQLLKLLRCSF